MGGTWPLNIVQYIILFVSLVIDTIHVYCTCMECLPIYEFEDRRRALQARVGRTTKISFGKKKKKEELFGPQLGIILQLWCTKPPRTRTKISLRFYCNYYFEAVL